MNASQTPDFRPAEESIGWAKSDISDLKSEASEFFRHENATVVCDVDEATGLNWYRLRVSRPIPFDSFKRRTVSALLNTRNCFDQGVNIAGAHLTAKSFKRNFPWSDSRHDLETHRLKGFPQDLGSLIKSQEPYPTGNGHAGGNDLLRALARLANNKHSIGFVVGALGGIVYGGENVRFSKDCEQVAIWGPNWDPVKQEVVLFCFRGGWVDLGKSTKFALNICLEVPTLSDPPEVGFALNEFLAAAERNLELMKAACGK